MLDSDLLTSPLEQVLLDLGAQGSTGCLYVTDVNGEDAEVYLRDGLVYSVFVPGRRPLLGSRLMSSGSLAPETLAEALEIQRTELQGWRLGELLVYLGFVDREVVESFVSEQMVDMLMDLMRWPVASWKFRKNKKARQDVAPPQEAHSLLGELRRRHLHWERLSATVGNQDSVPMLSSKGGAASDVVLGPAEWALLCKVDGERSLADLASDCGFTVYEAAQVIHSLIEADLVEVEVDDADGPAAHMRREPDPLPDWSNDEQPTDAQVADSVARVTRALEGLLAPAINKLRGKSLAEMADDADRELAEGPETRSPAPVLAAPPTTEPELDDFGRRRREAMEIAAEVEQARQRELERIEAQRKKRFDAERLEVEDEAWGEHRARLAVERAEAEEQAWRFHRLWLAEQRAAAEEGAWSDHTAWLAEVRAADEIEARAEHARRLEVEREEAEPFAWAEHTTWLASERQACEAEAWAEHAGWLASARVAAEPQAWADHKLYLAEVARLEVERLAAEQAARAAAEVAAKIEAQRLAAEEAARVEADRLAAEEAARIEAEEAARAAAERDARLEAERIAAEEAERLEAERVEAERLEAERLEAERLEAERLEAARVEAERLEAERLEAARVDAERAEAEHLETERLAAEEAARLEAERAEAEHLETERLAAEEAARLEAERAEAEHLEAERLAAEEAARLEAEQSARLEADEAGRVETERLAAVDSERAEAEEAARLAAVHAADETATETGRSKHKPNDEIEHKAIATPSFVEVDGASATSLLAQLNREASSAVAQAIREEATAEPANKRGEQMHTATDREALQNSGQTDTAALLRELSGLFASGNEDSKPPNPTPPPPSAGPARPQASPARDEKKKKRGLFGR